MFLKNRKVKKTTYKVSGPFFLVFLSFALLVTGVYAAGVGQLHIPPAEVWGSLTHAINSGLESVMNFLGWEVDLPFASGSLPSHPQGNAALLNIRFPRVALAVLVGAALGCSGALMQGIFGNPLAEPSVVGVSSGAAVGASLAIVLSLTFWGQWTTAIFAFFGGLVTTFFVYLFSRSNGRTEVVTLVLTGIAVNAFAFALIAFFTYIANTQAREQIVFWQLGSLNGARWYAVQAVLPFTVFGVLCALFFAKQINLLSLGERSARHVGVNVERLRIILIVVVALLVGAGVAFAGIISFVGLVVPHLVRMLIGPDYTYLIPASALGGALLLTVADLFARTLVPNADLPLGMLTALVGGPFFFWILRKTRSKQGGWA